MAWFDDPDEYYGPGDENTAIAQGDIVITPTATLFLGEGEPDAVAPELGEHRTVRLWRGADHDHVVAAPTLSAEVGWALAMVIPHNCAMEKDWNERVAELVASGASQGEAEQQAGSDTTLDPLVTVAPILPYAGLSAKRERSIRSGLRLSAFPVVGNAQVPEGYVDLNAMTSAFYTLVLTEQRVAALSRVAEAFLQKKLAMHFAYLDDSDLDVIAKAVGRRIVGVNVVEAPSKKSARVKVAMTLEDGETLVLEGSAPAPRPARQARARRAPSSFRGLGLRDQRAPRQSHQQ